MGGVSTRLHFLELAGKILKNLLVWIHQTVGPTGHTLKYIIIIILRYGMLGNDSRFMEHVF